MKIKGREISSLKASICLLALPIITGLGIKGGCGWFYSLFASFGFCFMISIFIDSIKGAYEKAIKKGG